MAYNPTNPVTVGAATKKDHYDRLFDNAEAIRLGTVLLDGLQFDGKATAGAPAVSSSGDARMYFNSDLLELMLSVNGGAFGSLLPPGVIAMWGTGTPPTGWLLCNGSPVSRTTYARLFAVYGTTWGVGNGSTTFDLPDLRGRTPIGAGTGVGLTARTLPSYLGEETHILTTPEIPSHFHTITDPGHAHRLLKSDDAGITQTALGYDNAAGASYLDQNDHSRNLVEPSLTGINATDGAGGSSAHNNMQPSAVLNFIIKF